MEKKFNKENDWEMLLDDQLIREAELLEKELFADDGFEDYQETQEELNASYEKLVNRLKADGIYIGDTSEDAEAESQGDVQELAQEPSQQETQENNPEKKVVDIKAAKDGKKENAVKNAKAAPSTAEQEKIRARKRTMVKAASFFIVSCLCIFAANMTSEADRKYVSNNIRIFTGFDTKDVTYNDETNENVKLDEYEAIAEIENSLNINVPEFLYRPDNMEIKSFEIDLIAQIAWIEYQCNENILHFNMDISPDASSTKIESMHGEENEVIQIKYGDLLVSLGTIVDLEEETPNCYASWRIENVNYLLTGRIKYNEMKKIINSIVF